MSGEPLSVDAGVRAGVDRRHGRVSPEDREAQVTASVSLSLSPFRVPGHSNLEPCHDEYEVFLTRYVTKSSL